MKLNFMIKLFGDRKFSLLLALTVLFQASISWVLLGMTFPSQALQLQLTVDSTEFKMIVDSWSAADLSIYLRHFYLDMIYPFIYGALIYRGAFIFQIPVLKLCSMAAALDLAENLIHILVLNKGVQNYSNLILFSSFASYLKWFLIFFCLILLMTRFAKSASPSPNHIEK